MRQFIKVAKASEIQPGTASRVETGGRRIALFNLNGEFFAIGDVCTHAEASLSEGEISGEEIVCPLHFASFDIKTGQCTGPPADDDVPAYPVRVSGDDIEIEI